jgi:hypothetical protein
VKIKVLVVSVFWRLDPPTTFSPCVIFVIGLVVLIIHKNLYVRVSPVYVLEGDGTQVHTDVDCVVTRMIGLLDGTVLL